MPRICFRTAPSTKRRAYLSPECRRPAAKMGDSYDVVIGGGAVYGLFDRLSPGCAPQGFSGRILVLDRDMTYQRAASSLSLSSIRQQFSSPINIRVGLYGVSFLRQAQEILAVDAAAPDLAFHRKRLSLSGERSGGADSRGKSCDANRRRGRHRVARPGGARRALRLPQP